MKDIEKTDLPVGWVMTTLGEISGRITKGATPTTYGYSFQKSGINFIKVQNVSGGQIDLESLTDFISAEAHNNQAKSSLKVDDVLFSIAGTIGETTIVKEIHLPANTNQAFAIISGFHSLLTPKFLEFQLRSFVSQATKEKARGGAMNNVSLEDLKALGIPLPPLPEQHRIVAKLEELLSELDKGIESFKTAREQLKVYRQALLKHAFEGKLTASWREENKGFAMVGAKQGSSASPAFDLCGKQGKSQNQGEAGETFASPLQEQISTKRAKRKDLPPLSAAELAELPELPEGWGWFTVKQLLSEDLCNGRSVKDRVGGFPVLRLNALSNGSIDLSVTKPGDWSEKEALNYVVQNGDFFVSRGNGSKHLVGRGGIANYNIEQSQPVAFPDTMIRIRLLSHLINLPYFGYCWDSKLLRSQIDKSARTTAGIYKINQELIENYVLPVPCRDEQIVIANVLDSKLSALDQLDQTITTALQQAETLRQSILKKAFSGQLVPQDPSDEPASKLLARIKAERDKLNIGDKGKKRAITRKKKTDKV